MPGKYEKAITISDAMASIHNRDYLLPAIQRKFVWSTPKICTLFDSIMREYPINTFMFWQINDAQIKQSYKFYDFLKSFCQRFNEENPLVPTTAETKDFCAIIDGQQRLTSLYIGLCGTYAYKQPRVWWPTAQDDSVLPPRKLYLDLSQPLEAESDSALMKYNFKFLTQEQYNKSRDADDPHCWFCMHEVLNLPSRTSVNRVLIDVVLPKLDSLGLSDCEFAQETLLRLYTAFRLEEPIHFFLEQIQDIDHVLDVFIRANSGGVPLAFSNLLMSIAVANWDGDFRQEVAGLTRLIAQERGMGFYIESDWILKTCLMLTDSDVQFKVQNFTTDKVNRIQGEWNEIKGCIVQTFILIRRFGINPESLISANAVIPICYYLYHNSSGGVKLYQVINNAAKVPEERKKISQWFYMVLLKGVFGGAADTILSSVREVLKAHIRNGIFPLDQIVERYKGTPKDLRVDDEYISSLLDIQYGEGRCRVLLHLLFPEMGDGRVYHIDHLHPKSAFGKRALEKHAFLQEDGEVMGFYMDKSHWNSVTNLHLLDESENKSKGGKSLKEWVESSSIQVDRMLLSGVDLEFDKFEQFYQLRREQLAQRLKQQVVMTESIDQDLVGDDSDEEVEDDPAG